MWREDREVEVMIQPSKGCVTRRPGIGHRERQQQKRVRVFDGEEMRRERMREVEVVKFKGQLE